LEIHLKKVEFIRELTEALSSGNLTYARLQLLFVINPGASLSTGQNPSDFGNSAIC